MMDLGRLLLLILVVCEGVFGIVINPQSPESRTTVYVHCLASNDVIQIKDPFVPSLINSDKFISMEWYKYSENRTNEVQLLKFLNAESRPSSSKFVTFEFWGLQINDVDVGDSAWYTAKFVTLGESEEWSARIEVASPPMLTSEKLSLAQTMSEVDNSVKLSCGQVASLGSPPVTVSLKAGNGTVLPAIHRNGFTEFTLSAKEADVGQFTCEIDLLAPAAKCIDSKDLPRWKGAFTGTSKIETAGSDTIGIIAGAVAGVIVLIIVIIIIFFVLKRRKIKSKTYNAKMHETRRDDEQNQDKNGPLLREYENPYDRPNVTRTPIYKGPNVPSPYMVSQLTQGSEDLDAEYEEMGYQNGESSPPRPTSGKFAKRGDDKRQTEKDRNKDKNSGKEGGKEKGGQKPPRAKPRSIFLTPSMEELDKINKAVAGGEGSGANGGIGTRV